ncbi:MAG: GNAT family N-acetyltransferase, partial [Verrucomicrobia bacterium]|nr:GNAT family N-acetyltransferase [Verrucomicrobiota bacterium]
MIETYSLGDVPDDVVRFLHDVCAAQDPVGVLSSSIEWLDLLTSHDASTARIVASTNAAGKVSAVLPMMLRPYDLSARLLGVSFRHRRFEILKVCGGDLIAPGVDRGDLAKLWDYVFETEAEVNAVWFDHIGTPDRLAAIIDGASASRWADVHVLEQALPHYRLLLPPDLGACLALRSNKSLSRLRSKGRALERDFGGELKVLEFRSAEAWQPYAERIDALMAQSWQVRALGHSFQLAHHRTAAARGMVRAFLLMCGERAVAFTLYYGGRNTLVSGFLGYDQNCARHSPGAVLFLKTLECLYNSEPPRFLDFGEGDADYK